MRVQIPWPDKLLWPNGGRSNYHAVSGAKKKAKHAASWATIEARKKSEPFAHDGMEIPVTLVVHAKPFGPMPDKDNCVAACKVQLDAIAKEIGVNDRHFAAPIVQFASPRDGKIIVVLG